MKKTPTMSVQLARPTCTWAKVGSDLGLVGYIGLGKCYGQGQVSRLGFELSLLLWCTLIKLSSLDDQCIGRIMITVVTDDRNELNGC